MTDRFPFSSVVGQDDAKLALQLVAVDPLIGGVLLRGEKGSAKTTLARGLASLLGPEAPFVDLPLGATEDRLIGTLDLAKALTGGELGFTPGLLARADGGVLYVDEVNLLADHLVDVLLDVAVSGVNRVEREALSHEHEARFVLIGSMNPEEGELRPQLLDRFGLSVGIAASRRPQDRAEAVRRRLAFDGAPVDPAPPGAGPGLSADDRGDGPLANRLASAVPARIPAEVIDRAAALALAVGAEGLRADLVLCRAAAANAGLEGRVITTDGDLRRVAPLVLAHRSRRNPFDPAVVPPDELDDAVEEAFDDRSSPVPPPPPPDAEPGVDEAADSHDAPDDRGGETPSGSTAAPMALGRERVIPASALAATTPIASVTATATGRRVTVEADRGRLVRDVDPAAAPGRPFAVTATVRRLAARRSAEPDAELELADLRHAVRQQRAGSLLVLAVDTSGSMGAEARARAATGTALGLLTDAYQRRDHVAVVTFGGHGARTVLQPTGSIEVARNRLTDLATGGPTPLAAGIAEAMTVIGSRREQARRPFLVLLTDGRANGGDDNGDGGDPLAAALDAAASVARAGIDGLVLDCETGIPRLGLAARLAAAMAVPCLPAADLDPTHLTSVVRSITDPRSDAP